MKVHETKPNVHPSGNEARMVTSRRLSRAGTKKAKTEDKGKTDVEKNQKAENEKSKEKEKFIEELKAKFEKLCRATHEHLSIQQMCEILEANCQEASGSDDVVVPGCQDVLFYGQLQICPVCGGNLEVSDMTYSCSGGYCPLENDPAKEGLCS